MGAVDHEATAQGQATILKERTLLSAGEQPHVNLHAADQLGAAAREPRVAMSPVAQRNLSGTCNLATPFSTASMPSKLNTSLLGQPSALEIYLVSSTSHSVAIPSTHLTSTSHVSSIRSLENSGCRSGRSNHFSTRRACLQAF